jgi:hypothetical protein
VGPGAQADADGGCEEGPLLWLNGASFRLSGRGSAGEELAYR